MTRAWLPLAYTGRLVRGPSGKKEWESRPFVIPVDPALDRMSAFVARKYRLDRPTYDQELREKVKRFRETGIMDDGRKSKTWISRELPYSSSSRSQ